jgi:hypothetical protein
MNALIGVLFVLIGTGMGHDAGLFLWAAFGSIEWLADRYAGWLFERKMVAIPAVTPRVAA